MIDSAFLDEVCTYVVEHESGRLLSRLREALPESTLDWTRSQSQVFANSALPDFEDLSETRQTVYRNYVRPVLDALADMGVTVIDGQGEVRLG